MALRPSQIRASSVDGALMIPGALGLRGCYDGLAMPMVIMAGRGDKVVFKRGAERCGPKSRAASCGIVEGVGHMLHYSVPRQVVAAIQQVAGGGAGLAQDLAQESAGRSGDPADAAKAA